MNTAVTANPDATAPDFRLEVLCDFPDDADHVTFPITARHLDSFMALLARYGVQRVGWSYYADERGGQLYPYDPRSTEKVFVRYRNIVDTYQALGSPLREAVVAAHRHGLEIYACYKPYETGPGAPFPVGSPEAKRFGLIPKPTAMISQVDPFVAQHPELRIRRRTGDLRPDNDTVPIATIKLFKHDDRPTRIRRQHLQIWASEDNYRFQPLDVDFDLEETVEPASHDVENMVGNIYHNRTTPLTRKGNSVRTLTLRGLDLTQRCILVTTTLRMGDPDFSNTAMEMMRVYDAEGRSVTGVFSNGSAIYHSSLVDFRNWGLMFDTGYGCMPGHLDASNEAGNAGLIAFARGHSQYLDGALCETETEVQAFWLQQVRDILATGVDGIDLRVENHSTHTDYPEDYGYNDVVVKQADDPENPTPAEISRIRGDAYTQFVRDARQLVREAGRRLRVNLQMDYLRPNPPLSRLLAYPANLELQWQRWVDDGLMDEAIFRFVNYSFEEMIEDSHAGAIVDYCRQGGVRVNFNRYPTHGDLVKEVRCVRDDDRFCSFIIYETCCFVSFHEDGTCSLRPDFNVPEAMAVASGVDGGRR